MAAPVTAVQACAVERQPSHRTEELIKKSKYGNNLLYPQKYCPIDLPVSRSY